MYPAYSSANTSSDGRSTPDTHGMFLKAEARQGKGNEAFWGYPDEVESCHSPGSVGTFPLRAKVTIGPWDDRRALIRISTESPDSFFLCFLLFFASIGCCVELSYSWCSTAKHRASSYSGCSPPRPRPAICQRSMGLHGEELLTTL